MGDLSLLPQNFVDEFHKIAEEKDKQAALDWAYDYEIKIIISPKALSIKI